MMRTIISSAIALLLCKAATTDAAYMRTAASIDKEHAEIEQQPELEPVHRALTPLSESISSADDTAPAAKIPSNHSNLISPSPEHRALGRVIGGPDSNGVWPYEFDSDCVQSDPNLPHFGCMNELPDDFDQIWMEVKKFDDDKHVKITLKNRGNTQWWKAIGQIVRAFVFVPIVQTQDGFGTSFAINTAEQLTVDGTQQLVFAKGKEFGTHRPVYRMLNNIENGHEYIFTWWRDHQE